jgi:hypothetical protein
MGDELVTQLIIWSLIFAICLIIEIITLGLTTIWFAGGALVAAISVFFDAAFVIQVLIFAIVSLVLLITTRPIALKHFNLSNMAKTNVESLIGKQVIVTETIDNLKSTGQVKANGLEWTARSANETDIIPAGTEVTIDSVSGVKLIVSRQ